MHCSNQHNGANENIATKDDEHNEQKGSWKKWCKWSPSCKALWWQRVATLQQTLIMKITKTSQ